MGNSNSVQNLWVKYKTLIFYVLIGGIGIVVDFGIFYIVHNFFKVDSIQSSLLGNVGGIINNFTLNSLFNFKKRDNLMKRFGTFLIIAILGMAIGAGILFALERVLGLNPNIGKLIALMVVVPIQYLLNKEISFRD